MEDLKVFYSVVPRRATTSETTSDVPSYKHYNRQRAMPGKIHHVRATTTVGQIPNVIRQ